MAPTPYGLWDSPISAQDISGKSIKLADIIVDPSTSRVFHLESRPSENGRVVLINDKGVELNPKEHNVRSGVHEYGGAAAIVRDGLAYYSNFVDRRVYRVSADGGNVEAITPENPALRYANFDVLPRSSPHILVSILEDHTEDTPSTVVNTLTIIDTRTSPDKALQSLVSGADFYSSPTFSPDGSQIAWVEWMHPDMPWEGSLLKVASFSNETFKISSPRHVAGAALTNAILSPQWTASSDLVYLSDETGYLNPYVYSPSSLTSKPLLAEAVEEDFSDCPSSLGLSPYALLDASFGLFSAFRGGRSVLYLLSLNGDNPKKLEIESPYVSVGAVRSIGKQVIAFLGAKVDAKATIAKAAFEGLKPTFTEHPPASAKGGYSFPKEYIPVPQPISLDISGSPLHVVYFPPLNPAYSEKREDKPPCIVSAHGGPTGCAFQELSDLRGYFTSRGWAWLEVNYSGSSCYGRAYRQRLQDNWGVLDTLDVVNAARAISTAPYSLVDPTKLTIRGGSAGGYTVLCAMSTVPSDDDLGVFAAGASLYGISDLFGLATDTHKFESHYLFKLVGGKPDEKGMKEVYERRSPVYQSDRIKKPLLLLQGADDRVVPKEQSLLIKASIEKRGGQVLYKEYPGEGHGWRKESTMRDAVEREEAAYRKWVLEV